MWTSFIFSWNAHFLSISPAPICQSYSQVSHYFRKLLQRLHFIFSIIFIFLFLYFLCHIEIVTLETMLLKLHCLNCLHLIRCKNLFSYINLNMPSDNCFYCLAHIILPLSVFMGRYMRHEEIYTAGCPNE